MEQNVKSFRNGIMKAIGTITITDERAKNLLTDSKGRLHTAVFLDKDTCKPIYL